MSDNKYFHFTLGPVQGFVAQARRTRDFWAGSFLLSWLAGVAICAVRAQGGKIVFPIPNDNFLKAIETGQAAKLPEQGGIPNRFMADISQCHSFDGHAVTSAVQQAWQAIADTVWKKDQDALQQAGYATHDIWQRQLSRFWDMSWVITQGRDTAALDKRKNFRTHAASVEDGYKCMMMEGFQELSGASDKHSGQKRRNYWKYLSQHISPRDIGEKEQLCAIAYVKRRFVHGFKDVKASLMVNGHSITIHGWKLPHNVPSVAYMAAVPWLKKLLQSQDDQVIKAFNHLVHCIDEMGYETHSNTDLNTRSERRNHVQTIQNLIDKKAINVRDVSLDGNIYFQTFWDNLNNFVADKQNYDGKFDEHRPKIKSALANLIKSMNDFEPSPYYAILLMDGDSLGKQMSQEVRQPIISKTLDSFTQQAQEIVRTNDGFLIYAGGDDVLALLSLDDAMRTANQLRLAYTDCFAKASTDETKVHSTLSGAINYCHIGTPLTQVLSDSHELLDEVAKEGTGRNALAVRVWKPSGMAVQWSLPWDKVINPSVIQDLNNTLTMSMDEQTPIIEALARALSNQKSAEENVSIFSSGFFYRMRDLMWTLQQMMGRTSQGTALSSENATKLLLAEYLQSGNFRKISDETRKQLENIFKVLIDQSKNYQSAIDDGRATINAESGACLSGDAGILIRILGQKGLGRGDRA